MKLLAYSVTDFNMLADVRQSKRGYPRIHFGGHDYGFKMKRGDSTIWLCTKSLNKRRCTASIASKKIGGTLRMKVQNPKHLCTENDIPFKQIE